MVKHLDGARVLMYSHDTFGLGHLRRCRTIAHSLVENFQGLSVLIISGSAIAGAFDFRARVDFVKIPSVIKLRNGEYTSLAGHIDIADTIRMRESIIRHTAESFDPDIFIVDKEPMGLHGELTDTLSYLKQNNTTLVLGMREIMDSPHLLAGEWERKDLIAKVDVTYDHIWIYGPHNFYNPLVGMKVPSSMQKRIQFVGFLKRQVSQSAKISEHRDEEYLLVTTGGGGDGVSLVNSVMSAYEQNEDLTHKVLVALGPYMPNKERTEFVERGKKIENMEIIDFESRFEELISGAKAVVSMGGYNTFCEIISFDKPALIIPRTVPREEQLLRAQRASELGLVDMLEPDDADSPVKMGNALRTLWSRERPSQRGISLALDGLQNLSSSVESIVHARQRG